MTRAVEVGSAHLGAGDDGDAATELFPEGRLKMNRGVGLGS
jgi:hypothetical protein